MEFTVQYLSFFVIHSEGSDTAATKAYKHYQTMDGYAYAHSELKHFLDGEFTRICKRKVEKNPNSEHSPTKIGRFIVEPGYELSSNPNYNLFLKLQSATGTAEFHNCCDDMIRMYMDTSAVRGGAMIIASAKLDMYFDEPFIFVLKCDFEPKVARISDETSLIAQVDMAISARGMKSIQYPFMPEEGMLEHFELKIHQASHSRYFEDFLKYVSYEKSMPEIVNEQVTTIVYQYIEQKCQTDEDEGEQERQTLEIWAASEKRDLQETWSHEQVMEAAEQLTELKHDLEFKFKLDQVSVKACLSDYGNQIHIARHNGKYVVLIEGDQFQFDRGISPIELLRPDDFNHIIRRIGERKMEEE